MAAGVSGQAPAPAASATLTAPSTAPTPATIAQLDWLHGCWDGKVNSRDFREEWLPLLSETMIGASQTVMDGKMQDFGICGWKPVRTASTLRRLPARTGQHFV